jgi:hypothetical protein
MSLILDGTNGLSDVDGSAATPAIRGSDANTGVFFGADIIGFSEGGTECARFNADAQFVAAAGTASLPVITTTGDVNTGIFFPAADTIAFAEGGAEAVRIDSSGIVLVGATSARTTEAKLELKSAANTALSLYMFKDTQVEATLGFKSSTDSNFYVGSGSTSVGTNGVFLTNTGNSWSSISDERIKTIVEPITNAAEKVATLRTVIGYYNSDEAQIRRPFLIAQDVQAVLPEAVNIQDQETGTLGMSYTDTIPLLVAAIKEQQAIITALTTRVEALEGAQA